MSTVSCPTCSPYDLTGQRIQERTDSSCPLASLTRAAICEASFGLPHTHSEERTEFVDAEEERRGKKEWFHLRRRLKADVPWLPVVLLQ
ncbi:Hypothetical protein SMAX5B_020498, partial [Scophthalmus maximus]